MTEFGELVAGYRFGIGAISDYEGLGPVERLVICGPCFARPRETCTWLSQ